MLAGSPRASPARRPDIHSDAVEVSFFFFAVAFRERPFEEDKLNIVKIYSEFQIFGILLLCIVIQTRAVDFDAEMAGLTEYGQAQIVLTLSVMPISIWAVASSIMDVVEDHEHEDKDKDERKAEDGSVNDNPLHEESEDEKQVEA